MLREEGVRVVVVVESLRQHMTKPTFSRLFLYVNEKKLPTLAT
jgi:hypothetical protein